jgi:hypothetical protein
MTRFDHSHDRGKEGHGKVSSEDGMFLVKSLELAAEQKPDFVVLMQWNDFEECSFIEPGWDFDGFNGDPYRYCRIVASAIGRPFVPAGLPAREQIDPFIRHRLFGDTQPGDAGPVLHGLKGAGRELAWSWGEGSGSPARLGFSQGSLLTWQPDVPRGGVRLSNPSALGDDGVLRDNEELRFYLDPAVGRAMQGKGVWWLAVEVAPGAEGSLRIEYRSAEMETYRTDSRWERRYASPGDCPRLKLPDGAPVYWVPLHDARPVGVEGDFTVKLSRRKGPTVLRRLALWSSLRADGERSVSWQTTATSLPEGIDPARPYVVAPYDEVGNPGLPRLVIDGTTVPSKPRYALEP